MLKKTMEITFTDDKTTNVCAAFAIGLIFGCTSHSPRQRERLREEVLSFTVTHLQHITGNPIIELTEAEATVITVGAGACVQVFSAAHRLGK